MVGVGFKAIPLVGGIDWRIKQVPIGGKGDCPRTNAQSIHEFSHVFNRPFLKPFFHFWMHWSFSLRRLWREWVRIEHTSAIRHRAQQF